MKKITLILAFLFAILAVPNVLAQKVAIIGANHRPSDGFSFVALEAIPSGEIIYFTENEYDASANAFTFGIGTTGEGVVVFTVGSALSIGDVVFVNEPSTNTFTVSCNTGVCGTAVLAPQQPAPPGGNGNGSFSLSTAGDGLYAYSDTDQNVLNGITEIYSVLWTGRGESPSQYGGTIPPNEDPSGDFPNAIVVDGFPLTSPAPLPDDPTLYPNRVEFNVSRDGVSKIILENPSSYTFSAPNAPLSTTPFTNLSLAGSNPVLTLGVSSTSVTENSGTGIIYTFTLNAPATGAITANFSVSGTATFNTDYTQSGAVSFSATAGTVTIPNGSTTVTFTLTPVGDTSLEPDETAIITITAGTGYDAGSPGIQGITIQNDDAQTVTPAVAITGLNHDVQEGLSFVALTDIPASTTYYFTDNEFNNNSLTFNSGEAVLSWTSPSVVIPQGEVIVINETSSNVFSLSCTSPQCGAFNIVSGSFSLATAGETVYVYTDNNNDPTDGITEIHAAIFTGTSTVSGGNIPAIENPNGVFPGSIVVDAFPASVPNRTEYDPTKRNVTVDLANFQNVNNWLHAQPNQILSDVPFSNIIISAGSAAPSVSVAVSPASVVEDGAGNLVFTFTLNEAATSDITVNFSVGGTAVFGTDYTASGAATFTATTGTVVITNGTSSANVTVDPSVDTDVETLETVEIMVASGTGYLGGSPNDATGTISNDDTSSSMPLVAITGLNHVTPDGFSFAAANDIPANTVIYFTDNNFDNTTLKFTPGDAVFQWTSPGAVIPKGDVIVVTEPSPDTFSLSCNMANGAACGSLVLISGNFAIATAGETFYAYADNDTDPTNGVVEIYATLFTGIPSASGGNIPTTQDPSGIFTNAVVVDGFPATAPNRMEYDETKRAVPIVLSDIGNIANWVHAQPNALLSNVPFSALNVVDNTPPTVTIEQATAQADPTATSPINFTVVFNEPVTDFTTGDVTLNGSANPTTADVTEIAPNDGTTYNVAVSGMTGDGTVIATVAAGVAIDMGGNLNEASTSTDNEITYDATAPTLLSIERLTPLNSLTNADEVAWTLTFSEVVSGTFDVGFGMQVTGPTSPASLGTSTGNNTGFQYTVTGGDLADYNGIVGLDIKPANTITDVAGNALAVIEPPIDETFELDNTAPTLVSTDPIDDATGVITEPVLTATFSEPVQFATGGEIIIQNITTGTPFGTVDAASGAIMFSANGFTIDPMAPFLAENEYEVQIDATDLEDAAGNPFAGILPEGWTFTTVPVDRTPPVAVCQDVMVQLDINGNATVSVTDIDNGSSDNEGSITYGVQRRIARLFDQNVAPEVIFGSGNANGGFTNNQTGSVELGLRAKVRYPTPMNTFNSNGDGTYSHAAIAGSPASRASWNFEWSVNTDPTGTAGDKLNGLTYEMGIDFDASTGTDYYVFDPINQVFADHAIGDNMTVNGGGTEATDPASYAGLLAANNVAQNSWNLDFFNEAAVKAFDPTVDGTYEVYLKAFDGSGARVGETKITVVVGNGGAPGLLPQSIDFTVADIGTNVVELIVVDAAGNVAVCTSTVTVKSACEVVIETQPQSVVLCENEPHTFEVMASGTGTIEYDWQQSTDGGATWTSNPDYANGGTSRYFGGGFVNVSGTQFRVIATSDNGTPNDGMDDCSATSETATLTVNPLPVVAITGKDSYCNNGNGVELDAGAGHSSYLWSPGGATTQTITALEGSYTVQVTNEFGCTKTSQAFMVTNNQPLVCNILQDVLTTDHETTDGVATVNTTGGTGQFTYLWDNGETTQTATTLTYGMHSVTVTDSNGCETTCQVDMAKELYCWTNLVQNVSVRGGNDGAARVYGNGGFRPFTYLWGDGSTGELNTALTVGTHEVTITDASGAKSQCSVTITEPNTGNCNDFTTSIEQEKLTTDHVTTDGVATVYPKGGTGQYTYLWDNGETTQTATTITYGMHSVTVTDATGCKSIAQIDIAKELYCWINLYKHVSVHDAKDGSAMVHGNGGYRPHTFLWDDGSTQQLNSNLKAGTHYVTITDATGATSQCSITITEPNQEVCDGIDNDGDGLIDEGFDQDGDGVADCFDICDKGDDYVDMDNDGIPDACDDTICIKDEAPMTECYQTAVWDEQSCSWIISGMKPIQPMTDCNQTAEWNGTTCKWDIIDGQRPEMPMTECYQMASWNTQTCSWDVIGDKPMEPMTECLQTAVWNNDNCEWDIKDGQPDMPLALCYQTVVWSDQICDWEINGEKPMEPMTECYETATFNEVTCEWDVTGTQPDMPKALCYQTVIWSDQICDWEINGDKPMEPVTECYETAVWNEADCQWDIIDGQSEMPMTLCYQTAVWSDQICDWEINGEKPMEPMTECYETATFNEVTCEWDVTGVQPEMPITACNETAVWNEVTCIWDIIVNNNDCGSGTIDQCETAYARSADETIRTCFTEIPNVNSNNWGWTNKFPSTNGSYNMDLYAAAGLCNILSGALVGNVEVTYTDGAVEVTVSTLTGYKMTKADLYVGTEVLPTDNNGRFTTAPGQFPYKDTVEGDFITFTFDSVNVGNSGNFYVVLHADVCPIRTEPKKTLTANLDLTAYPVPFKDNLNIKIESPLNMNGTLSLYNGIGQKVQDFGSYTLKKGENEINLNTVELPIGLYFIRMTSVYGTETLKILRK